MVSRRVSRGAALSTGRRAIRRASQGEETSAPSLLPRSVTAGAFAPTLPIASVSPGSSTCARSDKASGMVAPGALLSNSGTVLSGASICRCTSVPSRSAGGQTGRLLPNSASR